MIEKKSKQAIHRHCSQGAEFSSMQHTGKMKRPRWHKQSISIYGYIRKIANSTVGRWWVLPQVFCFFFLAAGKSMLFSMSL
jgi:hypothetical protein